MALGILLGATATCIVAVLHGHTAVHPTLYMPLHSGPTEASEWSGWEMFKAWVMDPKIYLQPVPKLPLLDHPSRSHDPILCTWQLACIYDQLQHHTVTQSCFVKRLWGVFFLQFSAKKHTLDKIGSHLPPYGLLNNHSDLFNYHHKNGHKIESGGTSTYNCNNLQPKFRFQLLRNILFLHWPLSAWNYMSV